MRPLVARLACAGLVLASIPAAPQNRPARNAACADCHRAQVSSHGLTGMANALQPAASAEILMAHPRLTFQQGPYTYLIETHDGRSIYRVSDGKSEVRVSLGWAFGLGAAGQTYLWERDGAWFESRVSYYKDIDSLDLTVGAGPDVPPGLEEALGRRLSAKGAGECFHCHSTGTLVAGALSVDTLIPGIQCRRCHEQSDDHAASLQHGGPQIVPVRLGSRTAEEISEFCGRCHRTWSQIAADGPHNITNVRFQPYRLTNSKCYDTADVRIRCTTCHDPHSATPRPASFFDARCQACHSSQGKAGAPLCKTGQANCAGCHMPKVELREAHNRFTDHWIRIVRPGEPPPH